MNFSFNGFKGISPLDSLKPILETSLAGRAYGNTYLKNGTHTSGVLEADGKPTAEKREAATDNVLKEFGRRYSGLGKAGSTPVLWGGIKYKKTGDNIKDSMLLEVISMSVPEIARCFGIPLTMIDEKGGSAMIKQEEVMIQLRHALLPIVTQIEQELDFKLLRTAELGKYFHRLNMNVLMRADTTALVAQTTAMFNTQCINGDEIRNFFGMPPMPNGEGKAYGKPFASNIKTFEDEPAEPAKEPKETEKKSENLEELNK